MHNEGFLEEYAQRRKVIEVARTWLRTPYHTGAMVKGAGVDCLTLLAAVFTEAGLISQISIPHYPADWHLHRDTERYLEGLLHYAAEIPGLPLPGDIILWKIGRCFSHGAIVVEWPLVIHAYMGRGCIMEDAEAASWLAYVGENTGETGKVRPRRYFSYWRK